MKKVGVHFTLLLSLFLLSTACSERQPLFQEDSNNWKAYGDAVWTFSDEILIGKVQDGAGFPGAKLIGTLIQL